jgi:hypothetical protein
MPLMLFKKKKTKKKKKKKITLSVLWGSDDI